MLITPVLSKQKNLSANCCQFAVSFTSNRHRGTHATFPEMPFLLTAELLWDLCFQHSA